MKNLKRKNNLAFSILISFLLLAGLILIFQLAKANFIPSISFSGKPQIAYPPPENTPMDFVWPTNTALPSPTVTPTPIILENGWYLYEDKEAGYSISYPPESFLVTSHEGGLEFSTVRIQFNFLKNQGYQGLVVDVLSNTKHQSVGEVIQNVYSTPIINLSLDSIESTAKKILVGETLAYLTTYQPFMFELCVFIPYGDKILFIVPVHDNLDSTVSQDALKIFWVIVETIKINL